MSTSLPQLSATQDHDSTLIALTVEEAARRLGVGRTTMFALIRTGEVPSIPIGRLHRVPAEALTQYVRRRMQESGFAPIAA
ncbi:helix-turn-helix domain-containing protein [Kitasatospora cineracea]|uniref:Excisionase family DNA binding protein n=1 Tax=Kitasatospora cineracea TaxID=88074 RepID=A0A8G1UG75_9ACTN|nr:helix-turn-helix domain-containing protein [Kitasatospora cineracea]ROR43406.1 excisionase family DNA binding protein [Kitasatospora cineracea]